MGSLTVIITVFNRVDFLRQSLLCLSSQSFLPDEVIISDDGSSEDVMQTLKAEAPRLKMKVKYVQQEHRGFRLSRSRNNAARCASGEQLIFFDQDIIYTKDFIKTFAENVQAHRFLVSWPIRLDAEQTKALTDEMISASLFDSIVTKAQVREVGKQYRKEKLYHYLKKWHLRQIGPKLRGGLFLVNQADYRHVNGFDEKYQGWGNEDDDLGRRLHQSGVIGYNPFLHEYPLHMYHPPYREGEKRVNQDYYLKRKAEIHKQGDFRCEFGLDNSLEDEEVVCLELN
jgi:glycosyltransferase involved in cell wall biosynthesis